MVGYGVSTTQIEYVKTIGNAAANGQVGFRNPVDVALGPGDLMYVLSHAAENNGGGKRVAKCTIGQEDFLGEFGSFGSDPGQFTWPNSLATDRQGNVYVTDEWLNRVTVFDPDGNCLTHWGDPGPEPGELNRPAGIAFDADDNLLVSDSFNHRVQQFTREGRFLNGWGSSGSGAGQLDTPWGICLDHAGMVYVADWRNDRIQKFAPSGQFLACFGETGSGVGQFNRPSGVAVDNGGFIYVADWGNDRVQVFDETGKFAAELLGDATMSKWGEDRLSSNPENMLGQRQQVRSLEPEKRFVQPVSVKVDRDGRLIVADSARHRLQIYRRNGGSG